MKNPIASVKKVGAAMASLLAAGALVASAGLLKNASFESAGSGGDAVAQNWKLNDPDDHGDAYGSATRESWRAHEGTWIGTIRGKWAEAGDYGGFWQEAEGAAGTTYRATVQLWADTDWTAEVQEIKIEFWNSDRSEQLSAVTNAIIGAGETWTEFSVDGMAPEGAAWIRAVIHAGGVGDAGALQIDEFDLDTAL
ncbi:MAG TPA: hypothetical protein VIH35_04740 [Kiritimatiellia bacterium]|jgi:hypothetical protein